MAVSSEGRGDERGRGGNATWQGDPPVPGARPPHSEKRPGLLPSTHQGNPTQVTGWPQREWRSSRADRRRQGRATFCLTQGEGGTCCRPTGHLGWVSFSISSLPRLMHDERFRPPRRRPPRRPCPRVPSRPAAASRMPGSPARRRASRTSSAALPPPNGPPCCVGCWSWNWKSVAAVANDRPRRNMGSVSPARRRW